MHRRWIFPCFAVLMLGLPLLPVPDFWITQSISIGLYALVALGLVLLTGVAGLTSFGQAAFVGIGAYAAAYLATQTGWPPLVSLAVGVALAVLAALLLGALTLRMSGHYLPLATIAWGLALNYTMANMEVAGQVRRLLGCRRCTSSASTWAPGAGCIRWSGRSRCWRRWR
jgi:branched-chain amino acid transport system permease protein